MNLYGHCYMLFISNIDETHAAFRLLTAISFDEFLYFPRIMQFSRNFINVWISLQRKKNNIFLTNLFQQV